MRALERVGVKRVFCIDWRRNGALLTEILDILSCPHTRFQLDFEFSYWIIIIITENTRPKFKSSISLLPLDLHEFQFHTGTREHFISFI